MNDRRPQSDCHGVSARIIDFAGGQGSRQRCRSGCLAAARSAKVWSTQRRYPCHRCNLNTSYYLLAHFAQRRRVGVRFRRLGIFISGIGLATGAPDTHRRPDLTGRHQRIQKPRSATRPGFFRFYLMHNEDLSMNNYRSDVSFSYRYWRFICAVRAPERCLERTLR